MILFSTVLAILCFGTAGYLYFKEHEKFDAKVMLATGGLWVFIILIN